MIGGKAILSLISLILLVGVIVGVVVVVHHDGDDEKDQSTKVQMKKVHEFCQPTEFKDACVRGLERAARNGSATLKDYYNAALTSTAEAVRQGLVEARNISVNRNDDPYSHMAIEDCKRLLGIAVDELESTLSVVDESDMRELAGRVDDFLNWLGAVFAYQTTCINSIHDDDYRVVIQVALANATELTSNAIDIVANMSDLFRAFDVKIPHKLFNNTGDSNSSQRRLLGANTVDEEGYPTWFPIADRKLLDKAGKGPGKGKGKGDGTGEPLAPIGSGPITPHTIVAKDGSGKFKSVNEALKAYPSNHQGRYIIYVKAGTYQEQVFIPKTHPNVFIYGDGAGKTIITSNKNFAVMKYTIMDSATFGVESFGFIAKGITFRNDAGPAGWHAVALRIMADKAAVFDCSIEGYVNSLFYHTNNQFYRNCVISGTIDFIFGLGSAVIQNSEIIVRKPLDGEKNSITADGRMGANIPAGVVLQNCRIVPEQELFPERFKIETYLSRPWSSFSTNVFMENEIGDFIRPEGYMIYESDPPNHFEETAEVLEYANRGPGAATDKRSKLFKKFRVLNAQEATKYTAANFIKANEWLNTTGAPFYLDLGGK